MHDLDSTQDFIDALKDDEGDELEAGAVSPLDQLLAGEDDDGDEEDLATELLSISNDEELEYFLGGLVGTAVKGIGQAVKGVSKFAKSPTGKALGGMLKQGAKAALPILGNAVLPGVGGVVGSALGEALEIDALADPEQELETAKRFVRLTKDAAQRAARAPRGASPRQAAKAAVTAAAKRHMPELVQRRTAAPSGGGQSGRWVRRGNKIILLGV